MSTYCRRTFWGTVLGILAGLLGASRAWGADYGYHAGHTCPACGRQVLAIYRQNYPRPGRHQHRCGSSTYWWH